MEEDRCGIRDPNVTVPSGDLDMVPSAIKILIKPDALSRVRRYNPQGTIWHKVIFKSHSLVTITKHIYKLAVCCSVFCDLLIYYSKQMIAYFIQLLFLGRGMNLSMGTFPSYASLYIFVSYKQMNPGSS